jgi:hypothetical protein
MKPTKNVVFVDFRKNRGSTLRGGGGGMGLATGVFAGLLALELLGAAVFLPSAISSPFFGPTVIALAVAGALGARRAASRVEVARTRRRPQAGRGDPPARSDGHPHRTLH